MKRLAAVALAVTLGVPALSAAPAHADPCELGCILKCIQSTVVSFCPPV